MANPMALTYANETMDGDTPSISYATVYPLGMFVRVIIAQVMIMFFVVKGVEELKESKELKKFLMQF